MYKNGLGKRETWRKKQDLVDTMWLLSKLSQRNTFSGLNYTTTENLNGDNRTAYLILEIVEVSFTSILGILVNILLRKLLFSNSRKNQTWITFFSVYGVLRKSKLFLLPWLAFHVFLILAAILTTIVVLVKAKPMIYRLFFLVPLGSGLYFIFCWTKVHTHHLLIVTPKYNHRFRSSTTTFISRKQG